MSKSARKAHPPVPRVRPQRVMPPWEPLPQVAPAAFVKDQGHYAGEAVALAAALGWDGDPNWVADGIQVSDARNYLTKVLHELHIAVHNAHRTEFRKPTTVDEICAHLKLDEPHERALVVAKMAEIEASEKAAK